MIENENNKMIFAVGTSPVFPFPIRFFRKSDLHCYLRRGDKTVELVQGTDFTVETREDYSNGANVELKTTGTANLPAGIPTGCTLVILRELPFFQETALPNNGKLPSEALERQLDKFAAMMQQLKEELSRCVKIAVAAGEEPESVIAMILGAKDMALDSASTAASAAAACSWAWWRFCSS